MYDIAARSLDGAIQSMLRNTDSQRPSLIELIKFGGNAGTKLDMDQ